MALGNWATMCWDENGKPVLGRLTEGEVTIEIYKNWIYIHDSAGWQERHGFSRAVVGEIHSGCVTYKRFRIIVDRHQTQNAMFFIIEYREYEKYETTKLRQLFGVACYGYEGEERVGVTPETTTAFIEWLDEIQDRWDIWWPIRPNTNDWKESMQYNQGTAYLLEKVGVEGLKKLTGEKDE